MKILVNELPKHVSLCMFARWDAYREEYRCAIDGMYSDRCANHCPYLAKGVAVYESSCEGRGEEET